MMNIEKLKQKILDLAIRGKLIPQNPNDESAEELIKKIQKEKQKLIEEGKIKPSKNESYIFKGSDNSYYEKIGNDIKNIDEEIPYAIPNTWTWCRLKSIGAIIGGGTPSTSVKQYWENGNIVWITPSDMSQLTSLFIYDSSRKITVEGLKHCSAKLIPQDSVIMSSRAPIGYLAISKVFACTSQGCKSIIPYLQDMSMFLLYSIKSSIHRIIEASSGTTFDEISGTDFGNILIAMPSLYEQKRISFFLSKIEDLLNRIATNKESIEKIIPIIKKKILDEIFDENSSYKSYYPAAMLKDLCKLARREESSNDTLPYIEANVIRGKKKAKTANKGSLVYKNEKIILVDGENSGEVMTVPYDGYMGSTFKLLVIDSKKIDLEYLSYYFLYHKQEFRENKTGSAIPHLNKKIYNSLIIAIPPLEQQIKVASKIADIFKLLDIVS